MFKGIFTYKHFSRRQNLIFCVQPVIGRYKSYSLIYFTTIDYDVGRLKSIATDSSEKRKYKYIVRIDFDIIPIGFERFNKKGRLVCCPHVAHALMYDQLNDRATLWNIIYLNRWM